MLEEKKIISRQRRDPLESSIKIISEWKGNLMAEKRKLGLKESDPRKSRSKIICTRTENFMRTGRVGPLLVTELQSFVTMITLPWRVGLKAGLSSRS